MIRCSSRRTMRRSGTILQEAVVAVALAAVVLAGVVQLVAITVRQRHISEQRAWAVREAANAMEQLMACPWDEVTPDRAAAIQLSESCSDVLPQARLKIEVASADDAEETRKIAIDLDWQNAAGHRGQPVRLVAWRYPSESPSDSE